MEYTKDVVINLNFNKKKKLSGNWFKRMVFAMQRDNYFTIVMLVSIFVLSFDYLMIKRFIDILNLL